MPVSILTGIAPDVRFEELRHLLKRLLMIALTIRIGGNADRRVDDDAKTAVSFRNAVQRQNRRAAELGEAHQTGREKLPGFQKTYRRQTLPARGVASDANERVAREQPLQAADEVKRSRLRQIGDIAHPVPQAPVEKTPGYPGSHARHAGSGELSEMLRAVDLEDLEAVLVKHGARRKPPAERARPEQRAVSLDDRRLQMLLTLEPCVPKGGEILRAGCIREDFLPAMGETSRAIASRSLRCCTASARSSAASMVARSSTSGTQQRRSNERMCASGAVNRTSA